MRLTSGEIHSLVPKVFVEKWLLLNKSCHALDKTNIYCNKHHKNNLPLILRNVSLGQGLLQTVLEFMMSPELPNCQHSGGNNPFHVGNSGYSHHTTAVIVKCHIFLGIIFRTIIFGTRVNQ